MNFGDFVEKWGTKAGKFALKKAKEAGERIQVAQEKAQDMSDEDLIRNFKWAANLERVAYGQELKNRGWYLKNGKWMQ
ncbi:MAG: hypothetical protein E7198_09215 [Schwartzia succinivorans]|uniref:hypothetical protein n=1 Tax=Schwartzia succinivorans TaxID=55507 RepID=UPI00235408E9|nr:hypothetical protein [Schwartzia succinivorans]MBE6097959.1 hypothetical protein [Schwartzia succinivorans]